MRAAIETVIGALALVTILLFVSLFLTIPGAIIVLTLWLILDGMHG